jgi:hypothetical protein
VVLAALVGSCSVNMQRYIRKRKTGKIYGENSIEYVLGKGSAIHQLL